MTTSLRTFNKVDVKAAGGLVWRTRKNRLELLLVHRPRYDDWSLPKGKLVGDETFKQAALREVLEETGVVGRCHGRIGSYTYLDGKDRPKKVVFYSMSVLENTGFTPSREVDEVAWLSLDKAYDRCTWSRDKKLVDRFFVRISSC